jgi:glutamate racemase
MSSRPIAVLDSGIGGLPYLSWLQDRLPHEPLIYAADTARFPYGEKTPEQVRAAAVGLARALSDRFDAKLLLVACNTASVIALDEIRAALSVPVVGVVPAVKTAASLGHGTLGVLATARTVQDGYWEELVKEFAPERRVRGYAAPDLVTLVEERAPADQVDAALTRWASRLAADGVDSVVLGCTHYLHLADDLRRHLGEGVAVVDSRDGVGRRVEQLLQQNGQLASDNQSHRGQFYFTASAAWSRDRLNEFEHRYREWARRFSLDYAGPWTADWELP